MGKIGSFQGKLQRLQSIIDAFHSRGGEMGEPRRVPDFVLCDEVFKDHRDLIEAVYGAVWAKQAPATFFNFEAVNRYYRFEFRPVPPPLTGPGDGKRPNVTAEEIQKTRKKL